MAISAAEQYFLELVNAARLDPLAAAAKAGVALNQGLRPGAISAESKAVLAPQAILQDAAADHSANMLARDFFNHVDPAGQDDEERAYDRGYQGTGVGENIGLASLVGGPNLVGMVEKLFDVLFDSPTHRANTMATVYTDLGLAVRTGDFQGVSVGVVTEVFGVSDHDGPILTGVAFQDRSGDRAYDVGEGLSGVTISAQGARTTTATAGGYALECAAGQDVAVTLAEGRTAIGMLTVDLGDRNAKLDLIQTGQGPLLALSASATLVSGISQARLLGLDDLDLTGSRGNDRLTGNAGDNVLTGSFGRDRLDGRGGADRLDGGRGNDVLAGGGGGDTFVFTAGRDRIADWGQGDRLIVNSKALGQPDLSLADLRDAATVTEAGLVMALGTHSLTLTGLVAFGDLGGRVEIV